MKQELEDTKRQYEELKVAKANAVVLAEGQSITDKEKTEKEGKTDKKEEKLETKPSSTLLGAIIQEPKFDIYIPPPPTDGISIPPPPEDADVRALPISDGPPPMGMSFPGVKKAPKPAGTYVPPPPKNKPEIPPPPPIHGKVIVFPISSGPSPSNMSFPGIL